MSHLSQDLLFSVFGYRHLMQYYTQRR